MQPILLSIIIVNWNGGALLRGCLTSIAKYPPPVGYEIVVVDNASSDDSVAWLRSADVRALLPQIAVHVIENADNAGFGAANNQGIAHGRGQMVLLLNPDTELTAGAIDRLIECLQSSDRIGACGPRLLNPDGSLQHSVWRNPPAAWEMIVSGLGLWRLIPRARRGTLLLGGHWDHATRRAVPMVFGAAILARRSTIDQVGGFDERFHMYGEDDEWCLRMTRSGWLLMFEPDADVVHHCGQLSRLRWGSDEQLRVRVRASFEFQRRCLSRPNVAANMAAGTLVMTAQRLWRSARRLPTHEVAVKQALYWAELKRVLFRR